MGARRTERGDAMAAEVKAGASFREVAAKYGVSDGSVLKTCAIRGVKSKHPVGGSMVVARHRIDTLQAELSARPTQDAYEAACKALRHWRDEAARLAKLAGVEPRQMEH